MSSLKNTLDELIQKHKMSHKELTENAKTLSYLQEQVTRKKGTSAKSLILKQIANVTQKEKILKNLEGQTRKVETALKEAKDLQNFLKDATITIINAKKQELEADKKENAIKLKIIENYENTKQYQNKVVSSQKSNINTK